MGGLLLASILLQTGTPEVLVDGRYLLLVTLAGLVGFFFAGLIARAVQSFVLLDALSLGLLCAVGTNLALRSGWATSRRLHRGHDRRGWPDPARHPGRPGS